VVCFYRDRVEEAMFQVFIRAARSGELETSHYFFRPSIVVQQLCSYIKQTPNGEILPDSAYELFTTPAGAPLIAKTIYREIIAHLIDKDYFTTLPSGALKPGARWQALYEHREIYSNLIDLQRHAIEVIDEMTGRKLGSIKWGAKPEDMFLFGGQARRTTRIQGRKLVVRAIEETAGAPAFRSAWRPLACELAKAVAIELGLPHTASAAEIAAVRECLEITDAEGHGNPSTAWIFHCAGDAYGLALGDLLENLYGVKISHQNSFCFLLEGELPAAPLELKAAQVRAQVLRRWKQSEKWFDMGCFHKELPVIARHESVLEAFDIDHFLRMFSGIKFVPSVP